MCSRNVTRSSRYFQTRVRTRTAHPPPTRTERQVWSSPPCPQTQSKPYQKRVKAGSEKRIKIFPQRSAQSSRTGILLIAQRLRSHLHVPIQAQLTCDGLPLRLLPHKNSAGQVHNPQPHEQPQPRSGPVPRRTHPLRRQRLSFL